MFFFFFPFGRAMELCFLTTILLCYLSYAAAQSQALGAPGSTVGSCSTAGSVTGTDKYKTEKE